MNLHKNMAFIIVEYYNCLRDFIHPHINKNIDIIGARV